VRQRLLTGGDGGGARSGYSSAGTREDGRAPMIDGTALQSEGGGGGRPRRTVRRWPRRRADGGGRRKAWRHSRARLRWAASVASALACSVSEWRATALGQRGRSGSAALCPRPAQGDARCRPTRPIGARHASTEPMTSGPIGRLFFQ
jgi:hypothetical protein